MDWQQLKEWNKSYFKTWLEQNPGDTPLPMVTGYEHTLDEPPIITVGVRPFKNQEEKQAHWAEALMYAALWRPDIVTIAFDAYFNDTIASEEELPDTLKGHPGTLDAVYVGMVNRDDELRFACCPYVIEGKTLRWLPEPDAELIEGAVPGGWMSAALRRTMGPLSVPPTLQSVDGKLMLGAELTNDGHAIVVMLEPEVLKQSTMPINVPANLAGKAVVVFDERALMRPGAKVERVRMWDGEANPN